MAKKKPQTIEEIFEVVRKKLTTRAHQEYYYKALEMARKAGLHEEFAEHMLYCLQSGFNPKHSVDLTKEFYDL